MSEWRLTNAPPLWYCAFWVALFAAYCVFWTWRGR